MQIITSPAKTQQFNGRDYREYSLPQLLHKTKPLIELLKKMTREELTELLKTSEKLTQSAHRRTQAFTAKLTLQNAGQALFTYQGDAYSAIAADRYSEEELRHAQRHLFILSALHGVLRPLDLIQPYRLEMTSPLRISETENLYQYWRDAVTEIINTALEENTNRTLVNLASAEYARIIDKEKLRGTMITITFREKIAGKYRTIPLHAKRARGLMIHSIITNRINEPLCLKEFCLDGYTFSTTESSDKEWLFLRE